MKRLSSQLCTLESGRRMDAADDFHEKLCLQAELKHRADKRIKLDNTGETLYTRESLPCNMFRLGGDIFGSVVFFLSHTRVHIRRFYTDQEGFLHPSKNGVSFPLQCGTNFRESPLTLLNNFSL